MLWTNRIAQDLSSMLPLRVGDFSSVPSRPPRSRLDCTSAAPALPSVDRGDRVRISKGVFNGFKGTVIARRGADRIVIAVDLVEEGVTLEVDAAVVQLLEAHDSMGFCG